jgi:hypothetical protein
MSIRALIVGVAALLLATGAAHAERRLGPFYKPPAGSPSPWTEADGEDIIFFAVQGITCEGVNYSVWQPYNVKLQKQLDFLRLTPLSDTPITGKFTHTDQGWFRNGKLCEDLQS